ncbi:MAG: DsbA family protein [Candidatus Niyogibacteria bacterium]|nr:DsbA family protein [Candidatus Niyogibacteria bacterium]
MNEENQEFQPDIHLTKKERRELRRQERRSDQERSKRSRGVKRLLIWGAVVVGLGILVYGIVVGVSNRPASSRDAPSSVIGIQKGEWIKGAETARVVVTEYGDFQCPACRSYFPVVKALSEEFAGENVVFAYRHFPLRSIHKNAQDAARASEAAGLQGKFWEMHDILYERQDDWAKKRNPRDLFIAYAGEIGVDMSRFESDFESDAVNLAVEDDYSNGISAGVNATPSFFINGSYINNPSNYEEFKSIIEQSLLR